MTIFDLDKNGIKKSLGAFGKTAFGRIAFVIAYSAFFIFLLIAIVMMILCLYPAVFGEKVWYFAMFSWAMSLISFVVGSAYFYKKLAEFVKEKGDVSEQKENRKE